MQSSVPSPGHSDHPGASGSGDVPDLPGLSAIPADVVLARAARALLTGILLCVGMVVVLALVTTAAVLLAGPQRTEPVVLAGQSVTSWAAGVALAAAVICWRGHLDHLQHSAGPDDAVASLTATRRLLTWLPRLVLAGCVVALTVWTRVDRGAAVGALVGSIVALQVVFGLGLLRSQVLDPARLGGPPQPPLSERIRRLGR